MFTGGSVEIELHVCVEGGPGGAASSLAKADNDFLDAIVILRVSQNSPWVHISAGDRSKLGEME